MRWLVGDIQGCVRELERLLAEIRFDPAQDELWCLGDLVNRGPHSRETLELWRDVGGRGILGNHDAYALLAHAGRVARKNDTLDDLFAAADAEELLARLRVLPVLVHLPAPPGAAQAEDVWIVHGGLHPHWTDLHAVAARTNAAPHDVDRLAREEVRYALGVRCCEPSGARRKHSGLPDACPAGSRPWDDFYAGSTLVVHGHWARRGYYRGERTMGLDSGCVYGGGLSAWNQDEDRLVRVVGGVSA